MTLKGDNELSTINWNNIKDLQSKNTKKQLKILYSFEKKDTHTIFVKGYDLPKSIWELYSRGVTSLTITDLNNNVLFQFINYVHVPFMEYKSGYMGNSIKDWNNLTARNKETMLRILLSQITEGT